MTLSRYCANRSRRERRGLASMLAMLYLVLFSVMAIGFFEACTTAVQISRNDRAQHQAQCAADSGMQFVRYQLGAITVDPAVPDSALLDAVATQLGKLLNGTVNMNGHTVQNTGGVIYIPSASDWTTLDSTQGTRFRAQIVQSGQFLRVTATGAAPMASRPEGFSFSIKRRPRPPRSSTTALPPKARSQPAALRSSMASPTRPREAS